MSSSFQIDWDAYSQAQILRAFLHTAKQLQAAIVFWNEPNSKRLYLLVNFKPLECQYFHQSTSGFIFSPFTSTHHQHFFLTAELLYYFEQQQLFEQQVLKSPQQQLFLQTLQSCLQTLQTTDYFVATHLNNTITESKAQFLALVEKGLIHIHNADLHKIVIARTKTITFSQHFDLVTTFLKLCQSYPQQFVSLLSTSEQGTWLGCSPELLLAINGQQLEAVALAGTKRITEQWTEKEYQEQMFVAQFIQQQLQTLNIAKVEQSATTDFNIGAIKHLQTRFKIHLTSIQQAQHYAERLLELLHPTPAVCGISKQRGLDFIRQYENFDRQLYCGYLGVSNIEMGETRLYVNIRCMQLFQQQAVLYAGAGVTQESDPEKEWQETELKCQTLLDFINP